MCWATSVAEEILDERRRKRLLRMLKMVCHEIVVASARLHARTAAALPVPALVTVVTGCSLTKRWERAFMSRTIDSPLAFPSHVFSMRVVC